MGCTSSANSTPRQNQQTGETTNGPELFEEGGTNWQLESPAVPERKEAESLMTLHFDTSSNRDLTERRADELDAIINPRRGFPERLEPYDCVTTNFTAKDLKMLDEKIETANPYLVIFREAFSNTLTPIKNYILDTPLTGQMSPAHEVTLRDPRDRRRLKIPDHAKHYVFMYPIGLHFRPPQNGKTIHDILTKHKLLKSPDLQFLLTGGYIYFNEQKEVIRATALCCLSPKGVMDAVRDKECMRFGKPEKFPEECVPQVERNDRFKAVVLNRHRVEDATKYAWISANEQMVLPKRGHRITFTPHGGFVYKFEKPKRGGGVAVEYKYYPLECSHEDCNDHTIRQSSSSKFRTLALPKKVKLEDYKSTDGPPEPFQPRRQKLSLPKALPPLKHYDRGEIDKNDIDIKKQQSWTLDYRDSLETQVHRSKAVWEVFQATTLKGGKPGRESKNLDKMYPALMPHFSCDPTTPSNLPTSPLQCKSPTRTLPLSPITMPKTVLQTLFALQFLDKLSKKTDPLDHKAGLGFDRIEDKTERIEANSMILLLVMGALPRTVKSKIGTEKPRAGLAHFVRDIQGQPSSKLRQKMLERLRNFANQKDRMIPKQAEELAIMKEEAIFGPNGNQNFWKVLKPIHIELYRKFFKKQLGEWRDGMKDISPEHMIMDVLNVHELWNRVHFYIYRPWQIKSELESMIKERKWIDREFQTGDWKGWAKFFDEEFTKSDNMNPNPSLDSESREHTIRILTITIFSFCVFVHEAEEGISFPYRPTLPYHCRGELQLVDLEPGESVIVKEGAEQAPKWFRKHPKREAIRSLVEQRGFYGASGRSNLIARLRDYPFDLQITEAEEIVNFMRGNLKGKIATYLAPKASGLPPQPTRALTGATPTPGPIKHLPREDPKYIEANDGRVTVSLERPGSADVEDNKEEETELKFLRVPNTSVTKPFEWGCVRCGNNKPERFRDTFKDLNWICCMNCGLTVVKTICGNRWITKIKIKDCNYTGSGEALGTVNFGFDAILQRDVALKKCDKAAIKRKKRGLENVMADDVTKEIEYHNLLNGPPAWSRGHHPENLLEFYETFDEGRFLCLAIELGAFELFDYVKSVNVPRINESKVPERISAWQEEVCIYFYQILCGVSYMHGQGFAHRDLGLENVLLVKNPATIKEPEAKPKYIAKIMDFGLTMKTDKRCTSGAGKPSYMSPECAQLGYDYAASFDAPANDVWCIGVTFFIMLCGGNPFPAQQYNSDACKLLMGGRRKIMTLARAYNVFHAIPRDAYEVLEKIFKPEQERARISELLATAYCKRGKKLFEEYRALYPILRAPPQSGPPSPTPRISNLTGRNEEDRTKEDPAALRTKEDPAPVGEDL